MDIEANYVISREKDNIIRFPVIVISLPSWTATLGTSPEQSLYNHQVLDAHNRNGQEIIHECLKGKNYIYKW